MDKGNGVLFLSVLGSTRLTCNGAPVVLRPRERSVLAALALRRDRTLQAGEVLDLVWGESPPGSEKKALQNQLVRLRRAAGEPVVATQADGYALVRNLEIDVDRFEALIGEGRRPATSPERRAAALRAALSCFDGTPFADLTTPAAGGARARLLELFRQAQEELAATLLSIGDRDTVALLERLVAEEPYREWRWWLLVVALYRSGQRRRARQQLDEVRTLLGDTGLLPSPELEHLDALVAVDDPALRTIAPPPFTTANPHRRTIGTEALVGRDIERDRVLRALGLQQKPKRTKRGRAALVVGEEGVGKTALLHLVARQAAAGGTRVLWGLCDDNAVVPLAPFVQMLEELAASDPDAMAAAAGSEIGLIAALSPTLRRVFADAQPSGRGGQRRLFETIERVLVGEDAARALLVVIDDLHLAPPTTRLLVSHLSRPEVALSLVAAARPLIGQPTVPDADQATFEVIELRGLAIDQVPAQLRPILDGDLSAEAATWLHEQSGGGNPLLLEELASELIAVGALRQASDDAWTLEPPENPPEALRNGLLSRIEDLSRPAHRKLQAAAVLGYRFRTAALATIVGEVRPALDEALQAGVVEPAPAGQYAFRHHLIHQALIEGIPEGTSLELHEAAAEALEQENAGPGELARHHLATAALDPTRALNSATDAAVAAVRGFAYLEAAEWYRKAQDVALDLLGDPFSACELAIRQGEALRQGGDPSNVEVLSAAANRAKELHDGDLLAQAALGLCRLGPTTLAGGVHLEAAALAEQALKSASDPALVAHVAATASLAHSLSGDYVRCRSLFERAESVARDQGDEDLLSKVLPYAYMALVDPDDLDRRRAVAEELVALGARRAEPTTEWEGHHLRFSVLLQQGDPALSESLARLAAITSMLREPILEWQTSYLAAALAHLHGDLEAAERLVERSLEQAGAVAESRVTAAWAIQIFALRSDEGRLDELLGPLAELVAEQPGVPAWRAALALVSAHTGDRKRALHEIAAISWGSRLPRDSTWSGAMCVLSRAIYLLGPQGAARAETTYDALAGYSGRMSWVGTCTLGPIDTALAMLASALGDEGRAEHHLSVAEHRAAHLGAPVFLAEVRSLRRSITPGSDDGGPLDER